ncbi:hypothetical protein AA13595_0050 [Gluconacetobacter johannae DSM 13595]|uniref:Helix-turn-helix domain-containing protein n=1 Tax=Gluconacetobacter johannae TaxID=112140 RepID=A0A7W4J952_9PROT|nr:YdaS family helix-turn-helix protein [Gluconacetobacter johannae]MBB2176747.1 hypothetical protein [Gluconacetobacter johannae]GBQ79530.1 hypothetical protein AA13595_0050 [Gluconacetobacter johannae DSM 13595]
MSHDPVISVIALFGGQTDLARHLSTSQGTVWGWTQTGRVPSKRIPQIIEAARRLDPPVYLTPNDFFPPTDAVAMPEPRP